ncbi:endonuclease, partial [Campylobacter jejuni]
AKRFYPANYSKGWIARSYLYMSKTYNIRLSDQERKLMEAWDKQYPIDEKEKRIRELL